MNREMALHVISELQKSFTRNFPKAGIEKIWPDLLKEPPKAMEAAFDFFALNSAFLPSPSIFLARVQTEGKRIRSEQTVKAERMEKEKEPWTDGNALERAARDEHAKYALQGINMMRRTDKTRDEKLDFFRVMEERYPGRGWGKAGAELQRYWAKVRPHWDPDWKGLPTK